ncbi:MAG: 50S ribosomal protein L15 [Candidatus Gracilibacteria bacterium]|jgi:large subunit ribosomal protein L15
MSLQDLRSKSQKTRKRIGRGDGSGHGSFSGRGVKGQNARAGGGVRPGFEGGQTPLSRKMPKLRGFRNPNQRKYAVINVGQLNVFENNSKVDIEALYAKKLLAKKATPVKLLSDGTLEKSLEITVNRASANAIKKVEEKKGKVTMLDKKQENA